MNILLKLAGAVLLNGIGIILLCKGMDVTTEAAHDIKNACNKPKEAPAIKA